MLIVPRGNMSDAFTLKAMAVRYGEIIDQVASS